MEFGVAIFSAVVNTAVPKLCTVISKLKGKAKIDATFIKDELESIQGIIQDHPSIGVYLSHSERGWIAELRRLAYDIEDCIDRFDVKKRTREEFAKEIVELKVRATETTNRLSRYIEITEALERRAQASSVPPAPSAAVPLPQELQVLLGKRRQWLVDNLNCLLYLCLFPRNHHVRRNPLIRRWLAEGLVQGEQVAFEHLEILIESSIMNSIQKSNNGKVKRCQPPDEMLQYIYQQSMSENFMLFCDGAAQLQLQAEMRRPRRLSVHPNGAANVGLNLPDDLSRLRTLAVFPAGASLASYEAILDFTRYQVLRVLDLKECGNLSEKHLEAICDQSLMKYLSIGGSLDRLIPRKIGDLEQLETLDLGGSDIVTVYKEVLLLPKLKHLLGKFRLSRSDTLFGTGKLDKLLQEKSVLETLAGFVIGERPGFPQLMMSLMRRLRKVKIWCNSNASQANLGVISTAITKFIRDGNDAPAGRSLSIDFQQCSGEFLNALRVDGSLASLKLRGSLSSICPQFVAQLRGIEELCLWSTTLSWNEMLAELSKLRVLKYLKLIEDNLGPIEIRPDHLRSLERICLVSELGLDITIQARALPRLVSLHMLCPNLRVFPGTHGVEIAHMAGLTEVALDPRVDQDIQDEWRITAMGHPNAPSVVIEIP